MDENRGVSFFTGGEGESVFSILRRYNPGLQGASYGSTRVIEIPFQKKGLGDAGLNLSASNSVSEDLPEMVRKLIKRIQSIPGWKKKWKMVSPGLVDPFLRPPF